MNNLPSLSDMNDNASAFLQVMTNLLHDLSDQAAALWLSLTQRLSDAGGAVSAWPSGADLLNTLDHAFSINRVIAFALILIAIMLGLQLLQSRRQRQSLENIERAYLFVNVATETSLTLTPRSLTIDAAILNHGKTPAEIIRIRGYASIMKNVPKKLMNYEWSEHPLPPGHSLAMGGTYALEPFTQDITDVEHSEIHLQEITLYYVGLVEYRDIFGVQRETGFCWYYDTRTEKFAITPKCRLNKRT